MPRLALTLVLAMLALLCAPHGAGAVVTNMVPKETGTGNTIATGTFELTPAGGPTQTVPAGGQVDLQPGPHHGVFRGPDFFTTGFDCVVGQGPTSCPFEVNPVQPFSLQAPPFGGLSLSPVYFGFHVDNLPEVYRILRDITPAGTFVNREDRRGHGDSNNSEDFPLDINFFGLDAAVGLPQVNVGPVQFNTGLHGILGGAEMRAQVVSRSDNSQSNRSLVGTGIAGGFGIEVVTSLPGVPGFLRDMAIRTVAQFLWGRVRGSSSRDDVGELGQFNFSPRESDDFKASWNVVTLGGDVIYVLLDRHLDVFVGARWREISTSQEVVRQGQVPGLGDVTRIARMRTRGDQVFFPVGAEVRVGNWLPALAPVMARLEIQPGPDSFGIFFKVGYLLGAGGSPNPVELIRSFFAK